MRRYATKRLREAGYITMAEDGHIYLAESGRRIAEQIYERHKVLTVLLTKLGVDEKQAREDACKVEHDLSVQSFDAIKRFMQEKLAQDAAE